MWAGIYKEILPVGEFHQSDGTRGVRGRITGYEGEKA